MAETTIGNLTLGAVDGTSLFEQERTVNGLQVSEKVTSSSVANFVGTSHQFAGLETDAKDIIGAINEANSSGGDASVIQLTQAEYTALTTAEKMNGSIYKLTDKAVMMCLDEEYHAVKELTSAQYEALTTAEQNNGTIYIQTDAETTGSDIAVSDSDSTSIAEALSELFLINTYTAVKSVSANGVVALTGADMGYNSIPSGYTPIVFAFSCTNSNDLFLNLNSLTATGSQQFGVIRNVSSGAQNEKNCTVKITFIKSAFL